MRVWNFPLKIEDEQRVMMPGNHQMLTAQGQENGGIGGIHVINLYALVDETAKLVPVRVRVLGTGRPFPDHDDYYHLATVPLGRFVWHVFVYEE